MPSAKDEHIDVQKSTVSFDAKVGTNEDETYERRISPHPIMIGVIVGIICSLYLGAINIAFDWPSATAKVFKYSIISIALIWMQIKLNKAYPAGVFTRHALTGSAMMLGVTAVIVAFANLIFYSINPEWGFEKFTEADGTGLTAFSYSGVLLFEIFAIGMIIAFIFIQFLKNRPAEDPEIMD